MYLLIKAVIKNIYFGKPLGATFSEVHESLVFEVVCIQFNYLNFSPQMVYNMSYSLTHFRIYAELHINQCYEISFCLMCHSKHKLLEKCRTKWKVNHKASSSLQKD